MSKRWNFVNYESDLEYAGGLADTPSGRRRYRQYLTWASGMTPEFKAWRAKA